MTAAHHGNTSGAEVHNDNSSAESIHEMLGRSGRHLMGWLVTGTVVGVLVFFWASAGVLVAPNPSASAAWWLVLGVVLAPIIGFIINLFGLILKYKPKQQKFRDYLADAGLNFADYILVRMVAAMLAAAVMVVVWSLLVLAYVPANLWIWLVGSQAAHVAGLGGVGAWIASIAGFMFLIGYVQLLRTLVTQPPRVVFWLILWTALVVVGLIPAIGWSTMHGLA